MNRRPANLLIAAALALAGAVHAAPNDGDKVWSGNLSIDNSTQPFGDAGQLRLAHALQGPALWSRDAAAGLQYDDLSGVGARFSIVRLAASLTKALPRDFKLRASVNSQYSRDTQFSAAPLASRSGRFAERGGFNDFGLAANVELYSPDLCGAYAWGQCRAVLFYDKAYLKRNREMAGVLRSRPIGSLGFGLRMQISNNANLQFDYGRVVRSDVTEPNDKARLHIRLGVSF